MDIRAKFDKLAAATKQLIQTDNALITAIKENQTDDEQVARVSRQGTLLQINQIIESVK